MKNPKGKIEYIKEKYPKIVDDAYAINMSRNETTIQLDYNANCVAEFNKIPYVDHKITDSGYSRFRFKTEDYGSIEIVFT